MHERLDSAAQVAEARKDDESDDGTHHVDRWKMMWSSVGKDAAEEYADAMNKLFNVCWEGTTYVIELLDDYFQGKVDPSGKRGICGRGANFVKSARRAYFETNAAMMPPDEVESLVERGNTMFAKETVRVLDIGSCHGGLMRHAPAWMKTTALDLQPAVPEVFQADWLDISLGESDDVVADDFGKLCLKALRVQSFDVVVMCYMLSFLPTGRLRWEACRRAHAVLSHGGLLLILEPRRGAHSKKWHVTWSTSIPLLGFDLIRTQVMAKSVSLLFAKAAAAAHSSPLLIDDLAF